jgi:Methyltransferase domain
MDQFKNSIASHEHSLNILNLLYEYDDFMDSLSVIADMGCGSGLDIEWWATRYNRDEPPEPHDYLCYAVDRNTSQIEPDIKKLPNVKVLEGNFEERLIPREVDLIYCHDAFQYVINPLQTLNNWHQNMSINGMLIITVPQFEGYQFNRMVTRSVNQCYYHYNTCNLMYMLAVNGFDCKDAFFYKESNNPWLNAVVYKSEHTPMDPATTSWHELVEKGLVNESVRLSLNKYGYVRQEDLLFTWLDKDFYFAKD